MDCTFTQLPYGETGYFTNLVTAYINGDAQLKTFYKHPPTLDGIEAAIRDRRAVAVDRELLVEQLKQQYSALPASDAVSQNIQLLQKENTFTVCTAHQPAIFTGNLFFIYKILHAIKLSAHLTSSFPGISFVPVFYMGCEDADLDELGHIYMEGEKIVWETNQKGSIGRMNTKGLEKIIHRIEGELSVQPFGPELVQMLREAYLDSSNIQTATLKLVHNLFSQYGLIIIIPDNPAFKKLLTAVFEDELLNHRSSGVVEKTIERLSDHFKVQAHPREINLFYLDDGIRQRIVKEEDSWTIVDTDKKFTQEQILQELHTHPERFSPNVILRGLLQETILPNVAFVGGGGEIAYWMELKNVFDLYRVPFPALVIRNSFLVMDERWNDKVKKLQLSINDLFKSERELLNQLVKRHSEKRLSLEEEIVDVNSYYDRLKTLAGEIDDTLTGHVAALQTRAVKPLHELEKKLLRAEKRKYGTEERQISALKKALFPNNNLQERVDNFMPYYAKWGRAFIKKIYDCSPALEQQFTVLTCR